MPKSHSEISTSPQDGFDTVKYRRQEFETRLEDREDEKMNQRSMIPCFTNSQDDLAWKRLRSEEVGSGNRIWYFYSCELRGML